MNRRANFGIRAVGLQALSLLAISLTALSGCAGGPDRRGLLPLPPPEPPPAIFPFEPPQQADLSSPETTGSLPAREGASSVTPAPLTISGGASVFVIPDTRTEIPLHRAEEPPLDPGPGSLPPGEPRFRPDHRGSGSVPGSAPGIPAGALAALPPPPGSIPGVFDPPGTLSRSNAKNPQVQQAPRGASLPGFVPAASPRRSPETAAAPVGRVRFPTGAGKNPAPGVHEKPVTKPP
jgi:hypothetical protein